MTWTLLTLLTVAWLVLPLILYSAGWGAIGMAWGFGLSAFFVTVVFIGFDSENLAVGVAGTLEGVTGIALGSIISAALSERRF